MSQLKSTFSLPGHRFGLNVATKINIFISMEGQVWTPQSTPDQDMEKKSRTATTRDRQFQLGASVLATVPRSPLAPPPCLPETINSDGMS